jgi:hypothetical protein
MKTPHLASDWSRIVEYPDNHLNDFCLFRDYEGWWRAIGIIGTGTWESEQSLFSAEGRDLRGRFHNLPNILVGAPGPGLRPQKHAPFVVRHAGRYAMFYRRPPGTILRVMSDDARAWHGLGETVFERVDARDICILTLDGVHHMYYCQSERVGEVWRSAILLRRSRDMASWSLPAVVHFDTHRPAGHSYLESPFVIRRPDGFYMFIRHRLLDARRTTVVLFSDRPDNFPCGEQAWFAELDGVHAPEVVEDGGVFYIARVSGPAHSGPGAPERGGWIEVARLGFR